MAGMSAGQSLERIPGRIPTCCDTQLVVGTSCLEGTACTALHQLRRVPAPSYQLFPSQGGRGVC